MGAYLSEPITEKVSSDENGERLLCGASSMQGWRCSQEDAHNCIINFDTDTSIFAVYDGHGGHEVAQYCSQKFPDFLKTIESYKNDNLKQALIDAFIKFDATLATPDVISILKEIAGDKNEAKEDGVQSSDEEAPEDVNNLYEEASMPIEKVIEKYQNQHLNKSLEGDSTGKSPFLRSKKISDGAGSSGESSSSGRHKRLSRDEKKAAAAAAAAEVATNGEKSKEQKPADTDLINSPENKDNEENISNEKKEKVDTNKKDATDEIKNEVEKVKDEADKTITNGDISDKGKELASTPSPSKSKAKMNTRTSDVIHMSKKNQLLIYNNILRGEISHDGSEDDSDDDEHDHTFKAEDEGNVDDDDDDDDDEDDGTSEESSDYDSEGDINEEDEDFIDDDMQMNMKEEPGSDSGCTAVVALLRKDQLYVANAGDSRCIVCRNGKVIEMSFDHKPENEEENSRIVKAGGKVTCDGRVNGGLNLSRAFGDHAYKQNKELKAEEQMITALPDITTLTITPEDEFMVLACDGIWNFMTNEEVVEFVAPRLKDGQQKISEICEEMFDHCLAPDTMGDGTGCDNMTAIIVQFKNGSEEPRIGGAVKRAASPVSTDDSQKLKKVKTSEESEQSASKKTSESTETAAVEQPTGSETKKSDDHTV